MAKIDELRDHYDTTDTSADLERAEFVPADAPPTAERMTTFAVRLPLPTLNRVRELADEAGVTTSELLRQWIDAGIAGADDDPDSGGTLLPVELLHALIDAAAAPAAKVRGALAELARSSGQTSAQVRSRVSAKSARVVTYAPTRTIRHQVKNSAAKRAAANAETASHKR